MLLFLADSPDGRMRMSELADSVLLSRSGLTRLVDRLERDGLLEREPCEEDARGYFAAITDRGRALFDRGPPNPPRRRPRALPEPLLPRRAATLGGSGKGAARRLSLRRSRPAEGAWHAAPSHYDIGAATAVRARRRTSRIARARRRTPSSSSAGSSSENDSRNEVCERRSAVTAPPGREGHAVPGRLRVEGALVERPRSA